MNKFRGAFVAIVTPVIDGQIDEQGLIDLIEFHIANGTHGIVPCGTTGESATMSHEEHHRVVALTVKTVNGRVPVVAGSGWPLRRPTACRQSIPNRTPEPHPESESR